LWLGELHNRIRERLRTCGFEPFLLREVDQDVLKAISLAIEETKKEIEGDIQVLVNWFTTTKRELKFPPHRVAPDVQKVLQREINRLKEDFERWFGDV